jgi:ABC-type multidrug transport system ATPase subunit/pSer/pThr/pTyr-binding forkhead associated (FHA) protein
MGLSSNYVLFISQLNSDPIQRRLSDGFYSIGRDHHCDIQLVSPTVSRNHVRLELNTGQCWISDLGSVNGTQIDGSPIPPRKRIPITPQQLFSIGDYILSVAPEDETSLNTFKKDIHSFYLKYRKNEEPWLEFALAEGHLLIGREVDCHIRLLEETISRHHTRLTVKNNQVFITDLGSRNGTLLNNKRLESQKEYPLLPGDQLAIDPYTFVLSSPFALFTEEQRETSQPRDYYDQNQRPPTYPLKLKGTTKITLGREEDNEIVLNHPSVSRYHAAIEQMGSRYRLLDMHSSNGVFVNMERVKDSAWIKPGDLIKIGPYQFNFHENELQFKAADGYTIKASHLNKQVTKELNILQNISLEIKENEFVALVGMSGAGKSTLMDALNGFRPATSGTVLINDIDLYQNYDMFRQDIGYVPQKDIVHMELTPEKALDYAAQLRMPPDTLEQERAERIKQTLNELDLYERKDLPIHKLSGGQLKRVSIGVELLTRPRLFFLDEPTSGLDPGTEYDMMKLFRRLADQGRTVLLITHATKNVILCDKIIIMARGGYLAFFGPPEEAIDYFDKYRTRKEQLEKNMDIDDVYRILSDEERGTPVQWASRFQSYRTQLKSKVQPSIEPEPAQPRKHSVSPTNTISTLSQLLILSKRNLSIMFQDKITLMLTLALAPFLGLINIVWGPNQYDPVLGDFGKMTLIWYMISICSILVGSLSSVREIIKEAEIYKRERAVCLKIFPYIVSKLWIGAITAIYQGAGILVIAILLTRTPVDSIQTFFSLLTTSILCVFAGYLFGLLISAAVPNQNAAMIALIAGLVPMFILNGVLVPLDNIPGGKQISLIMPTRWTIEGFISALDITDDLLVDPCLRLDPDERDALADNQKTVCPCMGADLFSQCLNIPGILTNDYYDESAKNALGSPKPEKPIEPTRLPSPTPLSSPTPLAEPEPLPTPTPLTPPFSADPAAQNSYLEASLTQQAEYFENQNDSLKLYQEDLKEQNSDFADRQMDQFENFAEESQNQYKDYASEMEIYGEDLSDWSESRKKAINGAEALVTTIYDEYQIILTESPMRSRIALISIILIEFLLILYFQKRKDIV